MNLLLRIKFAWTFLFLKIKWKEEFTYSHETRLRSTELPFQLEIRIYEERDRWNYRITKDRTFYAAGICKSLESAKKHAINNYAKLILTGYKYFVE